jgi:hypothetical protein
MDRKFLLEFVITRRPRHYLPLKWYRTLRSVIPERTATKIYLLSLSTGPPSEASARLIFCADPSNRLYISYRKIEPYIRALRGQVRLLNCPTPR